MKHLAVFFLIGVYVRHHSSHWLAEQTGFRPGSIFYMLGGLWEVALYAILAAFIWNYAKSVWRTIALFALGMGAFEGMLLPACRLAIKDIDAMPPNANMCDYATGMPITLILLSAYLIIFCYVIIPRKQTKG